MPSGLNKIKNYCYTFSAWGPPRHLFFIKGFGKIYKVWFQIILFLLSLLKSLVIWESVGEMDTDSKDDNFLLRLLCLLSRLGILCITSASQNQE